MHFLFAVHASNPSSNMHFSSIEERVKALRLKIFLQREWMTENQHLTVDKIKDLNHELEDFMLMYNQILCQILWMKMFPHFSQSSRTRFSFSDHLIPYSWFKSFHPVFFFLRAVFNTKCRKTKTKVITLANHKGRKQYSEPINHVLLLIR